MSATQGTTPQALGWALTLTSEVRVLLPLGAPRPAAAVALVLSQTSAEAWLHAELQGQDDSGSGGPGVH